MRKKIIRLLTDFCFRKYYWIKSIKSPLGSINWLIATEMKYGGLVTQVKRIKVSRKDPRSKEKIAQGGMIGGDRMLYHGYAKYYEKYLLPLVNREKPLVLVEAGILKGTGLAIWCDLFINGTIVGLDIDLSHFRKNLARLKKAGAFKYNSPKIHIYDSFLKNKKLFKRILKNKKIDVFIDDSYHATKTILNNFESAWPFLAKKFVYFIEDNKSVYKEIIKKYPLCKVYSYDSLTVVTRKR